MILCWAPGTQSAIHDHSNSHCLLKVLDGNVEESLYDWPSPPSPTDSAIASSPLSPPSHPQESALLLKKTSVYSANQVTYMHDTLGLHKISNPSSFKGAVSLHLYSPPYSTCKTFCPKSGTSRASGNIVFYSIKGERELYMEEIYKKLADKMDATDVSALNPPKLLGSLAAATLTNVVNAANGNGSDVCRKKGA